ncbi:hypothetical protein [Nocardioides aurantiacus]|uniref:hypothetical protein n=1 Tax=Nocardioides aurantiacus TaxID=86796 RepID=UPI0011CD9DFC|nr:hypothetical protein [Nocardioides aurantiacus]
MRRLVWVSGAFLVLQVLATSYRQSAGTASWETLWLAIIAVMLWMTYRRQSRVAWAFVVFFAVCGALLYGTGTPTHLDDPRYPVAAVAYLGQAWPLLTGTVRRHVRDRPRR